MSKESTIGDRIKQQREEIGISMQDLAGAVGVSAWQTVQQWENNATAPARKRLGIVAEVLGVTPEYLAFGDAGADGHVEPMADEATLRDYFAAKALPALIAEPVAKGNSSTAASICHDAGELQNSVEELMAFAAYRIADAMLAARAKP